MVVRAWELVLFLWRHPIISCLVLLFFSPPFFPIIVYFSPLLICTGLVIIAMVSMNMGERAGSEDLRNGTRHLHGPAVHVEMQAKPSRESWFEWMKNKEEKAKAWVDSRFFNQDRWHFRDTSALAAEEEPSMVVDYNDSDEGDRMSSYRELSHPTLVLRSRYIRPLQLNRDVLLPPGELAKSSNMSYSSVPQPEDIKPIPRLRVPIEEPPFEFSSLEHGSPASSVVPLPAVEQEVLKEEIVLLSPMKEAELLRMAKIEAVVEKETPSASKAESLIEEPSISDYKSEPRSLNERATEIPLVSLSEELLPPVGINESLCKAPEEDEGFLVTAHERIGEHPKSVSSEQSSALIPDSDQVTKVEALLMENATVSGDPGSLMRLEAVQNAVDYGTRNIQTSSGLHGSKHRAVDVLVSPELSASGEDRKASPEAEADTSVFSPSNQPYVIRPSERFIATEKIIFVDEPSEFMTVQSRSMGGETGQLEPHTMQKLIGQIVAVEAEPHERSLLKERSPEDGLDENIELCGDVPPTTRSNSEPMALVSRSVLEASSLSENALVVQSIPYPDELELLAAYMEPVMSINNDAALTTSGSVLDKSYSLNTAFAGGEEDDDLTARFYALKKSMSLHTRRSCEEPISLGIPEATNAVVPVYIPDIVTPVESSSPFSESLVFSEKNKSRPGRSSRNVESVESITARLQKKFTPTAGNDTIIRPPPTRPVPALPAPAVPRVNAPAPVESDKSANVIEDPIPPVDVLAVKSKLPATVENSPSKKSLTSFLSRRREKLMSSPLMEAFSNSGEAERGKKTGSAGTDTVTSAEVSAEDRDEGSTTTSGRVLKEKMISPLKRVFSMDTNAGSSRKVDTLRVSPVKSSPVREKQSVLDRSKTRVMKLFSSDGGLTKLEPTEIGKVSVPDTVSLRKSKSVSKTGEQNAEFGEVQNALIRDDMSLSATPELAPSSEVHGIEDVGVKLEKQVLPGIEAAALAETAEEVDSKSAETVEKVDSKLAETVEKMDSKLAETVEKVDSKLAETVEKVDSKTDETVEKVDNKLAATVEEVSSKLEPLPSSPTEERMPPPTLESRGPDDSEKVSGKVTKTSSQKKFSLSWIKSEKQVLPGIAVAASLSQTAEQFDIKLEPLPSCPTEERMPPPNLDTGRPHDSASVRGDRVTKPSREKKFLWSWTKSDKLELPCIAAESLAETLEELDNKMEVKSEQHLLPGIPAEAPAETAEGLDSKVEVKSEQHLLAGIPAAAPAGTAEEVDSKLEAKSEKHLLPDIAATAPTETAEELDSKLEPESEKQLLPGIAAASPAETAELDSKLEPVLSSPTEEKTSPPTVDTGEPDDFAKVRGDRVTSSSSEKKFAWSWTKKKRSSEPQCTPVDQLRSPDDVSSLSGRGIDDESREILMSPLPRFNSSSAMSPVNENAHTNVPPRDENHSSEFGFVRLDSNSNHHHDAQKTDSPHKKSARSWWGPKADSNPTPERVAPPKEKKKISTSSWWSRRNSRADSKAAPSRSDLSPAEISSNNVNDRIAVSPERSGPLSPSSTARDNNSNETFAGRNTNRLQNDIIPDDDGDDDLAAAAVALRPRHRRERSDSLPASRGKFSRLRGRQTSLSEIALPRTPELELSPACSGGRAADYHIIEKSTSFSTPRRDEDHLHEDVKEKRNSDPFDSSNRKNIGWRTKSTPLTSYQIKPSSVRTLDLASEQVRGSPFHRSDLDMNSRLYRNSPSGAEIRITDKLKVPLEEVLSLLSTGDSDEQHNSTTSVAGEHRKASSSSSSEEEISSEEEWSATSDDEHESQQQHQQKQQQFAPLPPAGRIRRRLPHYIFSRGEATAN